MRNVLRWAVAGCIGSLCILAGAEDVKAEEQVSSCELSEGMYQQYEQDGTLDERMQYYTEAGMDSFSETLIQKALEREKEAFPQANNLPDDWGNIEGGMAAEGEACILLLQVDFPDVGFAPGDTKEALADIAFEGQDGTYPYESLAAYYERASYGKLHISGEVWEYSAKNERSYYELNGIQSLFEETLAALDETLDYSKFDGNHDGYIDGIYLHFAGMDTGWASIWWSMAYGGGIDTTYDGMKVGHYVTLHNPSNTETGARTLIHETGHVLGLPDYYSTQENTFENGICTYDMMYNNSGDFNGFSKWLLGWIEEDEVLRITQENWEEKGMVSLAAVSGLNSADGYKVAVISPENQGIFSEYFLIEYDTSVGNQSNMVFRGETLPDGFRIFHVNAVLDESGLKFSYANVNQNQPKLIELVDPDETQYHMEDQNGVPGAAWGDYHCKWREGDTLSPYTKPWSSFEGGQYTGYTGIWVQDFVTESENPGFSVKFEAEAIKPNPELFAITPYEAWKNAEQSNVVILPVELSMEAGMQGETEAVDIEAPDGQTFSAKMKKLSGTKYLLWAQAEQMPEGEYRAVFPEGYFDLGLGVGSPAEELSFYVGKNAEKTGEALIDFGNGVYSCADRNGGWYLLLETFGEEQQLYHIGADGESTFETLDTSGWTGWISPQNGMVDEMACLEDGTLVLKANDWMNGTLLLAHIDGEGHLLDEVQNLNLQGSFMEVVGNTVKLFRISTYGDIMGFWSVDFQGGVRENEVTEAKQYGRIFFLEKSYLWQYISTGNPNAPGEDDGSTYLCYDYYEEDDKCRQTFSYRLDGKEFYSPEQIGAVETDGKLYLFGMDDYYDSMWTVNDRNYMGSRLICYTLDAQNGQILSRSFVLENMRYAGKIPDSTRWLNVQTDLGENGIMLEILNYLDGESTVRDAYFIDMEGKLVSGISLADGAGTCFSGGRQLQLRWSDNQLLLDIYSGFKQTETETPDTPGEIPPATPEGPQTVHSSGRLQKTTQTAASTGDSNQTEPYVYVLLLAASGVLLIFTGVCRIRNGARLRDL